MTTFAFHLVNDFPTIIQSYSPGLIHIFVLNFMHAFLPAFSVETHIFQQNVALTWISERLELREENILNPNGLITHSCRYFKALKVFIVLDFYWQIRDTRGKNSEVLALLPSNFAAGVFVSKCVVFLPGTCGKACILWMSYSPRTVLLYHCKVLKETGKRTNLINVTPTSIMKCYFWLV